ncbi:MAG: T9SS type A sorting domain-containing protein [Saprospiraceae bacterium]
MFVSHVFPYIIADTENSRQSNFQVQYYNSQNSIVIQNDDQSEFSAPYKFSLLNLQGMNILSQQIQNGQTEIKVNNLPTGIYLYKIETGQKLIISRKIKI